MKEYLEQYFDLLINTNNLDVIKEFLPNIMLDNTNQIIDILLTNLKEELKLSIELDDKYYENHLKKVIILLESQKKEKIILPSLYSTNILIFSSRFKKSLSKLNDSLFYSEINHAIECLTSKEWMTNNDNNTLKYKRLHGVASGLSEIKTNNTRLLHIPINGDFWLVLDVLKKEGNNTKSHQQQLKKIREIGKNEIDNIIKNFSSNGELNYSLLKQYAIKNNQDLIMELNRWEKKKNGKNI